MNILIDTSPLSSGHAGRGIGAYTRFLVSALQQRDDINVLAEPFTKNKSQRIDLVHFPFFDLFFASLPSTRVPTVVTIHDVIPLQFPAHYPVGIRGRLSHLRQASRLGRAKAIVTDSQRSKQQIVELLGCPQDKVIVVHLAANPLLFPTSTNESKSVQRKHHLSSPYVLFVGDINYNKNLPELIKAFRYLPSELQLVLLGKNFKEQDIPEWHAIERQIAAVGMVDRVRFLTDVPPENVAELSAIYSGALCYVQPSLEEGFGLPVLEAMRCGTPVVASNCGAHLEIGGESAWFVDPDAESIAGGIKAVSNLSTTERNKVIDAGQKWEKQFTWENVADNMIRVYTKVLQ